MQYNARQGLTVSGLQESSCCCKESSFASAPDGIIKMSTCHMSVEHVSSVNKSAALVVAVQHIHQLVPLFSLQVGAKGGPSSDLELDQIQGSAGVNH